MLRLSTDENFNNDILRGLLRQLPELDIVRIQARSGKGAGRQVVSWQYPRPSSWCATQQRGSSLFYLLDK
jgi:hypothetical protein